MRVNSIDNNQTNFQAKLQLSKSLKTPRWNNIAKEFESQTTNAPDFLVRLTKEGRCNGMLISICKENDKNFFLLNHALKLSGTDKLMNLDDSSIIQKLMKLLNIAKENDKLLNNLPKDIQNLEQEYGVKFTHEEASFISSNIKCKAWRKLESIIKEDDILSKYISFAYPCKK